MDEDVKQARELYDKYGDLFERLEENDLNRRSLSKILHSMIGDIKGKKILDVGCGAGRDCKIMAEKGAKVIGIDVSPKMIALAQEKCKGLDVEFYLRDMERTGFPNEEFDIITAIFSVSYKKSLKKVLREFYRILKKNGEVFIVVSHPIRKMIKYTHNYFESGKHWENFKNIKRFGYYRTMEEYINSIISEGFVVREIREPKPKFKNPEENFYPHHLLLRIRKPTNSVV
jgi:ubiquinone/menaquinone biosynthesis C-methylase UbiE